MLAFIRSGLACLLIFQTLAVLWIPTYAEGEDDPLWNRPSFEKKVYTVGQRLLAANGITERIEFLKANRDVRNASASRFGGPNTVVIYKDMLDIMDSDDELAAVLAHEIAHITQRHTARTVPKKWAAKTALWTAYTVGGTVASLATGGLAAPAVILGAAGIRKMHQNGIAVTDPIGRPYEKEADLVGLDYMVEAGYNPLAMETVMTKIAGDSGPVANFFSSHPGGTERLTYIHEAIKEKYPQFMTEELTKNPLPGSPYQLRVSAKPPEEKPADLPAEKNADTSAVEALVSVVPKAPETPVQSKVVAEKLTPGRSDNATQTVALTGKQQPEKQDQSAPLVAKKTLQGGQSEPAEFQKSPQPIEQSISSAKKTLAVDASANQPGISPISSKAPSKVTYQPKPEALKKSPDKAPAKVQAALVDPPKMQSVKKVAREEKAESVALVLLTLQPNHLRILRMISQRGYLSRREMNEQMEYLEPETLEATMYELQRKNLIRILGAEPDEVMVLTEWATEALKPATAN